MADSYSEPALFKGTSSEDCEIFVAMIRRRALEQGKQRDREWMAIFASSCLIGDALYWYECLDEDVQNDWSRLRPALLERFGRSGPPPPATSSTPVFGASAPPTTIPTPAAAPPIADYGTVVRRGRLKVLDGDGCFRGYLAKGGDTDGVCRTLSTSPNGGLLLSFATSPSGEPFEMQIIDHSPNPQITDYLAICWENVSKGIWIDYDNFVAGSCLFSKVSLSNAWHIEKKVWTISKGGELSVEYPTQDGGTEKLEPLLCSWEERTYWMKSSAHNNYGYDRVRIVVDDVV